MEPHNTKNPIENPVGEYLKKNYLDRKNGGMTLTDMAAKLNISRQSLYLVISGKQPLSPALAMRLSDKFGESIPFWLSLSYKEVENIDIPDIPDIHSGKTRDELLIEWAKLGGRTLVDVDIRAAQKMKILSIEPFDPNCIQPASYDLRIGNQLIVSSNKSRSPIRLDEHKEYLLRPNEIAVACTYERLVFPKFLLGRLGLMTDLSSNGILVGHGIHVDPGFQGQLYVTLFNQGFNTYPLQFQNTFITLEFNYLPVQPHTIYEGPNQDRNEFSDAEYKTVNRSRNY